VGIIMNQYFIEHKIKTLAELYNGKEPLTGNFYYKNYEFKQWDFSKEKGPQGKAWIVKGIISADSVIDGINNFRKELSAIIDRIGFISQCYTTIESEPFIVVKENNNPEKIFLLQYTKEINGVPLHFDKEKQMALNSLENYDKQAVFKYLSESTRAGTYYTRLAMLIIALESIAGEKNDKNGQVHTDKEAIKQILKEDNLYEKIFNYKTGIRNKIFHGKEVKFDDDYVKKIYAKIVEYFNENYQTKINTTVINPQRTFTGNYQEIFYWLKPNKNKSEVQIDLKNIIEEYERYKEKRDKNFLKKFSFINPVLNY